MRQKNETKPCVVKKQSFFSKNAVGTLLGSTVILRGSRGATVYGCRQILYYSPQKISLQIRDDILTVCGSGLYCSAFSAGTVTLQGEIAQVLFENLCERNGNERSETEETI